MENSYKYFKNTDCKYFPCHKGLSDDFNCLFCYCPMYSMPNCPGSKTYIEKNGKKIKVCTDCTFPHRPENNDKIIQIEKGSPMGGFTVVRGKHPIGKGRKDTILLLIREDIKGNIVNFSVIIIDGKEYVPNVYYDFDGRKAEE